MCVLASKLSKRMITSGLNNGQSKTDVVNLYQGYFSFNDFYGCSVQRAIFKGIITITELRAFFNGSNVVGVFDLHARDASECQKSLSEKQP